MAYGNERWTVVGATAAADLSAHQRKFVRMTGTGINLNTADGGEVLGVLGNNPTAAGQGATVVIAPSVMKVRLGANPVAQGDLVRSDGNGLGDVAGAGQFAAGVALEAGAAGETITVQLMPFGNV